MSYPIYRHTSPVHGGERSLRDIKGIVLHYTFGYNAGDKAVLLDGAGGRASVHFFIPDDDDKDATAKDKAGIYQTLPLTTIGWSVGKAVDGWSNAETVSIEIGNRGNEKPTAAQYAKLDWLIAYIDKQLGRKVPIRDHEEIALPKGRKAGDVPAYFPLDNYKRYRTHKAHARKTSTHSMGTVKNPPPFARYAGWSMVEGQAYEFLGTRRLGRWSLIRNAKGQQGYVPSKYLK